RAALPPDAASVGGRGLVVAGPAYRRDEVRGVHVGGLLQVDDGAPGAYVGAGRPDAGDLLEFVVDEQATAGAVHALHLQHDPRPRAGLGLLTAEQVHLAPFCVKVMVPVFMPEAQEKRSVPGLRVPRSTLVSPLGSTISWTPSAGMVKARAH